MGSEELRNELKSMFRELQSKIESGASEVEKEIEGKRFVFSVYFYRIKMYGIQVYPNNGTRDPKASYSKRDYTVGTLIEDCVSVLVEGIGLEERRKQNPIESASFIELESSLQISRKSANELKDVLELCRTLLECEGNTNFVRANVLMRAVSIKDAGKRDGSYTEEFIAVQRELVSLLVEHGIDINAVDASGKTALTHALKVNNIPIALHLIECGARADSECLIKALQCDRKSASESRDLLELCRTLLSSGVDMNVVDRAGKNVLMHVVSGYVKASVETQRELVSLCLSNGIDINAVDFNGKPALKYALASKNSSIASYLIDHGARVDSSFLIEVLHLSYNSASESRDLLELCRKLLSSGVDVNVVDRAGKNVLMHTVSAYYSEEFIEIQRELVSLCSSKGIDINAVDINGKTALMYALESKNSSIALYLIEKGARVDSDCLIKSLQDGCSARKLSMQLELCCLLLSRGVDVNVADQVGKNVLMYVVSNRDDNYPGKGGYTEGFLSTQRELVSLLLSFGIDTNAVDKDGNSAWSHAVEAGNSSIASYLVEKGARVDSECLLSALQPGSKSESNFRNLLKKWHLLLSSGVDVKVADDVGMNGLMHVVSRKEYNYYNENKSYTSEFIASQRELVSLLLEHGIDINCVDSSGKTALSHALEVNNKFIAVHLIERGARADSLNLINEWHRDHKLSSDFSHQIELCRLLLSAGVDVKVVDQDGKNVLMHVVSNRDTGHLGDTKESISTQRELVSLLLEYGIDTNAVDRAGKSALHHALKSKNSSIASYLIERGACVESEYLLLALQCGHESSNDLKDQRKLVSLLLDHGVDVVDSSTGKTALKYAIVSKNSSIASYLIERGVRVESEYLLLALQSGRKSSNDLKDQLKLCRLLLEHGVDVNVLDSDGKNVLMHVVANEEEEEDKDILLADWKFFLMDEDEDDEEDRDCIFTKEFLLAQHELVSFLLDGGIAIDAVDSSGRSAWSYATEVGNDSIASYLVERGAHADSVFPIESLRDMRSSSDLSACLELCRKLLSSGAKVKVNVIDNVTGKNILMYVVSGVDSGYSGDRTRGYTSEFLSLQRELVSLLLDSGIDLTVVDHAGKCALTYALESLNNHIATYLFSRGASLPASST
jgi:ankyrin repeat protein